MTEEETRILVAAIIEEQEAAKHRHGWPRTWYNIKRTAKILAMASGVMMICWGFITTITFACFMMEEGQQMCSFAGWIAEDVGDPDLVRRCAEGCEVMIEVGENVNRFNRINFIAYPVYKAYFGIAAPLMMESLYKLADWMEQNNTVTAEVTAFVETQDWKQLSEDLGQEIVSYMEASKHIDEVVLVELPVIKVSRGTSGKVQYANTHADYRKQVFCLVTFPGNHEPWSRFHELEGCAVVVVGKVGVYNAKPQIIIESWGQIIEIRPLTG